MGGFLNNRDESVISTRSVGAHWLACGLAFGFAGVPAAWALTDFSPYATAALEHNSNVFARSANDPAFASSGNTELGDTILHYLAGANLDLAWERDRLRLNVEGQRFDFNHFSELNHNEYKFGGDFDWHLGPVLDGSFVYNQSRIMSPLANTLSEQLELQTDRSGTGTFRILVTPQWRLDLIPKWHELVTPLPQFPEFGLHETAGAASINYLGINRLTAGLQVEYTSGSYAHIIGATRFHQTTEGLTANYALTGFSSFDGQLGYTQRNSSLINPADANAVGGGGGGFVGRTTAFTGALGARRQLSVKTNVYLRVFREVDSYTAGANSEIGTGGDAGVTWDPDVKFSVTLHYRQETQSIQGDLAIANFVNRVDHLRSGELYVKYHIVDWLTLRPYASRESRSSNFAEASYNATVVGIDLTARLK